MIDDAGELAACLFRPSPLSPLILFYFILFAAMCRTGPKMVYMLCGLLFAIRPTQISYLQLRTYERLAPTVEVDERGYARTDDIGESQI